MITIETLRFFRSLDTDTGNWIYYAVLSRQLGADWYECLRLNADGTTELEHQNILWLKNMTDLTREQMTRIDENFVIEATRLHQAALSERLRA